MFSLFFAIFLFQAAYLDLYQEGYTLLQQGQVQKAEQILKESALLNPDYVPTLKALAESYVELKRFSDAIGQYQHIVELNPKDINARSRLAELYSWVGNYDKSIVTYKDALELDAKNLGLNTGLAKVLRWSQRYDEAERLYKKVLDTDQENHDALKGLAKTYAMSGDLTGSLEMLNKAVKLYPDDPELHKELGTVLAWQKEFKKALASLEKSIELSPKYADAYRSMGDVYVWMKSYQQAMDAYKKAAAIEPHNIENYLLLAKVYKQAGNKNMAEEAVKTALRIDPSAPQAIDLLHSLREDGKYQTARRVGEFVEFAVFLFVFALLFFTYRSKRRMLMRRHRLYAYFIHYILPPLVFITFVSFISKDRLAQWVDAGAIEDISEAVLFFALGASLLALLWKEHRSHDFIKTVILAVGAHPDDIELGCGGFIMKAKDSGAKVYGLTMTKGEKGTEKNGRREEELRQAAMFMEMDGHWVMDFPDTGLKDFVTQMKDAIEERIKEVGATMVLTHSSLDIHTDHQAVFEATKVAARNISALCYEDVSTPREFVPNYFIDITGYIEDKMRLIAFHKTQEAKNYMDPEVIKGRAAHRGLQGGVQYAEAYRIYKLLR